MRKLMKKELNQTFVAEIFAKQNCQKNPHFFKLGTSGMGGEI